MEPSSSNVNDGMAGEMGMSDSAALLSQMMRLFCASRLVRNSWMGMETEFPVAILCQYRGFHSLETLWMMRYWFLLSQR